MIKEKTFRLTGISNAFNIRKFLQLQVQSKAPQEKNCSKNWDWKSGNASL